MNKKLKNYIMAVAFICIIYGLMFINLLIPDADVSYAERRRLRQIPTYSMDSLIRGDYFSAYEKYFLDQFAFRDEFRRLNTFIRLKLFNQKDNNDNYVIEGNISKIEYPLNEKAIVNAANKINEVYEKYLQGSNVNYTIIPDKNYYLATEHGYLAMDYEKLIKLMNDNIKDIKYIDIFPLLELEDYYKTDIHWKQERLEDVADFLLLNMGNDISPKVEYSIKALYPFYGSYYGQAAMRLEADTLVYLTNEIIDKVRVYDHIDKTYSNVYMEDKFATIDSYDLFLSGAKSIITLDNPMASTNKELIIFRDSFGSSIAPLMIKNYAKITLIDLRYLSTDLLGNYMDFSKEQDVLFLYNTIILNNSYMLK
ncbi:MAG: hypothetical protein GX321_00310 [Clostridiales bacterium]|nr:hypothetical protein [Clostridiales bacterium]